MQRDIQKTPAPQNPADLQPAAGAESPQADAQQAASSTEPPQAGAQQATRIAELEPANAQQAASSTEPPPANAQQATRIAELELANARLAASSSLYHGLFQSQAAITLVVDLQDGKILEANQAACQFYGLAYPELTRLQILDLVALPREEVYRRMQKIMDGEIAHMNVPHRRGDGQIREVEAYLAKSTCEGRPVAIAVVHDVTERNIMARALHESEDRYKSQYRNLPLPTYTWQFRDDDFVLIDFNEAAQALYGTSLAKMRGRTATLMYPDRPDVIVDFQACHASRQAIHREFSIILRSTGDLRDLKVAYVFIEPDLINVYTEDITERNKAQVDLIERIKELTCLHEVSQLIDQPAISEASLCQQVIAQLPPAMQYPALATARLEFNGEIYVSGANCEVFTNCLTGQIMVRGQASGQLMICYPSTTAFLLPFEQNLIDNLANMLGHWFERIKSEAEVHKFSQVVAQNPANIVITDPEGNINYVNPAFVTHTGYTVAEVLGKNPRIMQSGKTSLATYQQLWKTILSGQTWRGELYNRKKNSEYYWESISISPIFDEQGAITDFLAVKEDITAWKRDQERVEEMLKFNQAILNNSPLGILIFAQNGPCLAANPAACRLAGADLSVLMQQNLRQLTLFRQPEFSEAGLRALRTGRTVLAQFYVTNLLGRQLWLNCTFASYKSGGSINLLCTCQDETERRRAEEKLKLSNDKLAAIVAELEQGKQDTDRLRQMSDMLQVCLGLPEAYAVIGEFAPQIFPDTAGAVYIVSPSQRSVESMVNWGQALASEAVFAVSDCWALRRGQIHKAVANAPGPKCLHVAGTFDGTYCDIPLIAAGETLGLLHFEWPGQEILLLQKQELFQIMADHIAMSLSNISLRESLRAHSV